MFSAFCVKKEVMILTCVWYLVSSGVPNEVVGAAVSASVISVGAFLP